MIVAPLASHSTRSLRDALLSHGWEGEVCRETAAGVEAAAFHCAPLPPEALLALVREAGRLGLEVITGDDWAILSGARSRLSAFARPWSLPPELAELSLGIAGALPADLPAHWDTARGTIALAGPVLVADAPVGGVTPQGWPDPEVIWVYRPGGGDDTATADEAFGAVARLLRGAGRARVAVETSSARVAGAALAGGAAIVRDPSGLREDPGMAALLARTGAGVVVTAGPVVGGVPAALVSATITDLRGAIRRASDAGIPADRIVVDPDLGGDRPPAQAAQLLRELGALRALGRPVWVSPSPFAAVPSGLAAACVLAFDRGARLFHVPDPTAVRAALAVAMSVGDA